jgi:hypothetical protein
MTEYQLFALTDYEDAFRRVMGDTINALMRANDPVLGMMPVERREHIEVSRNTFPSGEVVDGPPMEVPMRIEIQNSDVFAGNVDGLLASLNAAASEGASIFVRQVFDRLGRLTDAAGTSVDAEGQPLSWDLLLAGLERIEIDFDEDGKPEWPTLIMHPDMFLKLKALPPPDQAQEGRLADLLKRKREDFHARQRRRRLS